MTRLREACQNNNEQINTHNTFKQIVSTHRLWPDFVNQVGGKTHFPPKKFHILVSILYILIRPLSIPHLFLTFGFFLEGPV